MAFQHEPGRRRLTALALALAALGSCGEEPPPNPAVTKPFSVRAGFLRDESGRALVLRGANVSGEHKQKPYFDFHTEADFARMSSEWGMNAVRFLVSWAAIEPEKGAYDVAYLDAVATRVTWAEHAGLLVVLDMHQDLYGEGFLGGNGAPRWTCDAARYAAFVPATPWFFGYLDANVRACVDGFYESEELLSHYAEAWRRLAVRLATSPNVVGFDPMNEPHWGSESLFAYEETRLTPLYARVVGAVREAAPAWVAFLEPGSSRNLGSPTKLPKPDYAEVVYAPHAYDSQAESAMGFDPSHRAAILRNVALLADEARALGAALWIGEYGGPPASGIDAYMRADLDAFDANAAGATYWDYSKGGYGLLADDGRERRDVLDVITRPYPARVAGDGLAWSWDEAARALTVTYAPLAYVHAPTIVSVPSARRPVTVECDGCVARETREGVELTQPPRGSPARFVVHTR